MLSADSTSGQSAITTLDKELATPDKTVPHLGHVEASFLLRKHGVAAKMIEELPAIDVVQHQVELGIVLVTRHGNHDSGMTAM